VPDKPLNFTEIANECSLFIGAGGSMTRVMAILGIPTVCVYQGELLDVDRFLIEKGLMQYDPKITDEKMIEYVNGLSNQVPDKELLVKGKQAYDFFKTEILKYDE
jgi:predicted glycosyltransferase